MGLTDNARPAFHFTPTLEIRERYERRIERDFDAAVQDNRSNLLSRARIGISWTYGEATKGELRYQYAHDMLWRNQGNKSTEMSNIDLAYVEHKMGGSTLKIGRQRLPIGHGRLIEDSTWSNSGKSFDIARVTQGNISAFVGKVGVNSTSQRKVTLGGLTYKHPKAGLTFYSYKHDGATAGKTDIHTLDQDWDGQFGPVKANIEAAYQFGKNNGKDHRAWAYHGTFTGKTYGQYTPVIEVGAASGGNSATESTTFDNLWGAGHDKYGLLDMTGWKNMNKLAVGTEIALAKGWKSKVQWGSYSLRDKHDGWYNTGGSLNTHAGAPIRDVTGASGRYLGQELGFAITGSTSKNVTVSFGAGVFLPGSFIKKATGGGDRQHWGYTSIQYKF